MESRLSQGNGTMTKCGWEGCPSLFSTGTDMNEHVFHRHMKHIEFLEGNNILLRILQPQESGPPSTPSPNLQPSSTSSVESNRTCGKPVEKKDVDIPINYSTCSDTIQICQLMLDYIGKLPEKRFENPANLEFCLPCLQFKGHCNEAHTPLAEKLKRLTRYKDKMEKKRQVLTKEFLLEQLGKLKKLYMNSGTAARKSNPSTKLV
ncbi:hypothetical protein CAEBREN_21586 [Caenorhabditis brenneri]|uniref:Zap1-like C2H2 zinc finger 1 domain-containing protein n=1 Tax=Caenorhabditis brenneri TaxID=135651 RepID=G0PBQ2_CAEBE|nr:hypothetical protein CAEBREN_21586 [Caenorhabditis brenneri]